MIEILGQDYMLTARAKGLKEMFVIGKHALIRVNLLLDRYQTLIAIQLANDGFNLLLHYNQNINKANQVKEEVESIGRQAQLIQGDFNSSESIKEFIEKTKKLIIQDNNVSLHTIVHNAGHATSNGFGEVDYDEFDRLFNANVKAPYFITQSLIGLIESNGRIINLSSGVTRIAFPHMMAYKYDKRRN